MPQTHTTGAKTASTKTPAQADARIHLLPVLEGFKRITVFSF